MMVIELFACIFPSRYRTLSSNSKFQGWMESHFPPHTWTQVVVICKAISCQLLSPPLSPSKALPISLLRQPAEGLPSPSPGSLTVLKPPSSRSISPPSRTCFPLPEITKNTHVWSLRPGGLCSQALVRRIVCRNGTPRRPTLSSEECLPSLRPSRHGSKIDFCLAETCSEQRAILVHVQSIATVGKGNGALMCMLQLCVPLVNRHLIC